MRRADGVATHLLHRANLADKGSLVDGGSKRTEVVVQAHSLNLPCHAVKLKTVILRHTHRAYTNLLLHLVNKLVVAVQTCYELVEIWRFGRP